jgi:putative endopeptidase
MTRFPLTLAALPLAVLALACAPAATVPQPAPAAAPKAPADSTIAPGLDLSVAPGDDFFRYANGGWYARTEIPADRAVAGNFADLAELTAKRTAALVEELAKGDAKAGSDERKIADVYATYLDEAAIEAKGLAPLQPALDAVTRISSKKELAQALGAAVRANVDVLNQTRLYSRAVVGLWVAQDLDEPSRYSPFLLQGGLGLPDRDYYLSDAPRMVELRGKYQAHVAALLRLGGQADAEAKAARIVLLETRLAKGHTSRTENGEVRRGNVHWTRAQLEKNAPGLDWAAFLGAARLEKEPSFVAWNPGALTALAAAVGEVDLGTWKEYCTYHALAAAARWLPKAFVEEMFGFFGTTLSGTPRLQERWKRAIAEVDGELGEALGRLYVARHFPAAEKARASQMVKNVIAAFDRRIDQLGWMAPATKAEAKAKLRVLEVGVGYPDKWRDYSGLSIIRGDALGNHERSSRFDYQTALARLQQPVDRKEWVMNPQLVNAVNLPAMNALNFPAAILQPPYFDPSRPEAFDYGAAGAVIGHEVSHSFDSEGALFDAQGRLRNWWTPEDFAHFEASGAALVKQFDAYQPFPDLHVNGKLTLGENIADVAGVAAAFDAWKASLGGKPAPMVDGLTGEQQFFIGFGQAWRSKIREAAARQGIVVDGHAPGEYRADTVRNVDAWYAAFGVQPGQKLYLPPEERVKVW